MPTPARHLVPDSEGLEELLNQALDVLEHLDACEDEPDDPDAEPWRLPAPLAEGAALDALYRVRDVLAAHLDVFAPPERPAGPRLLGPDGRYEHLPLRAVVLDPADLAVLRQAHQVAARALDPAERLAETNPGLRQSLADLAEALEQFEPGGHRAHWGGRTDLNELGEALAPLERLLTLLEPADEDTEAVLAALDQAPARADVVLTSAQEAAYQRLATRIHTATGAPRVHRYLY